jgi:3-phenylpropionate/trans-cinnamate dioxygenase ferredoxin reductase component
MARVAVVGAGVAGVAAALEASRWGAQVTVFDSSMVLPSRRSSWPGVIAGESPSEVVSESVLSQSGVSLRLGEPVQDVGSDRVTVRDAKLGFDACVLSTGGHPVRESVDGEGKDGVHVLDSEQAFLALRESLGRYSSVVVSGSGLTAAAVADQIRKQGVKVTLLHGSGFLGGRFGGDTAKLVEAAARDLGVALAESRVEKVAGMGRAEAVLARGKVYPCDGVVVVPGLQPSLPPSNLTRGRWGGVVVDGSMRSSGQNVFAAGDCAEFRTGSSTLPAMFESTASAMGRIAGANSAGRRTASSVTNSYSGELFGVEVCAAGITLAEASACELGVTETSRSADGAACSLLVENGSSVIRGVRVAGTGARRLAGLASLAVASALDLKQLAYVEWPDSIDISPVTGAAREALVENVRGGSGAGLRPG